MSLSVEERCELLRRSELFAALDAEALGLVAERTQELEFAPAQYIVRQGDLGTGFYVIVRGRARVVRRSEEIDTLGPGDSFGEIAVLDQMPRTASVQAEEPTVCLGLASWDLTAVLERHPTVTLGLLRQLVRRLRPYLTGHRH